MPEVAISRNHFRSVVGELVPPVDIEREYIRACIDLVEPYDINPDGEKTETAFYLLPGQTIVIDFTYNTGYPEAHAFGVFFFNSFNESTVLKNALTIDIPATIMTPQVPQGDVTGEIVQEGTLTVTAPMDTETTVYWGAIVIYQQDLRRAA